MTSLTNQFILTKKTKKTWCFSYWSKNSDLQFRNWLLDPVNKMQVGILTQCDSISWEQWSCSSFAPISSAVVYNLIQFLMDTEAIRALSHKTNSVGSSKFLAAFIMANLKPSSLSIRVTWKKKNRQVKIYFNF